MTYSLEFSDLAEADLREAFDWYEHIRPGLAADLVLCVEEVLDRILERPEAFPAVISDARRALVRRFPYGVIYRVRGQRVEVMAVFHVRRDPTSWQPRIG
jgi:plasmid stabilization system protein ParE